MTEQNTDLQNIAAEARSFFEQATRTSGETFWRTGDNRPQWLQTLIFDAHGDMLPDDQRYRFIVDALDLLEEYEHPESIEIESDIMTADLTGWLHSRTDRYQYCDQAIEEYGGFENTLQLLTQGQYAERAEVLHSVQYSLEVELEARQ